MADTSSGNGIGDMSNISVGDSWASLSKSEIGDSSFLHSSSASKLQERSVTDDSPLVVTNERSSIQTYGVQNCSPVPEYEGVETLRGARHRRVIAHGSQYGM